jgi:hypothetical protein
MKKNILIVVILVVIAVLGIYVLTNPGDETSFQNDEQNQDAVNEQENATSTENVVANPEQQTVAIGQSADGNNIVAHRYGTGDTEILLVSGIHGGYAWNTSLLGYQLVEYFDEKYQDIVPENVTLSIIPVLNPDGLEKVTGTTGSFEKSDVTSSQSQKVAGRFNGNEVDLNRNFDCDWNSVGTWQNREVDGGDSAFSEPESQAIRNYIDRYNIDAAVVYYSSAGGVFASNCYGGVLPETSELTNEYAEASGYPAYEEFDFYEITGDMVNWMAKIEIPAISVLLTSENDTEFDRNLEGIKAILDYYAE